MSPISAALGAFGLLDPACLAVPRFDTGQRLWAKPWQSRGFDPAADPRCGAACSIPRSIRAYLELHIEQGPTLVQKGLPAAVVTGIRGCQRFRNARCFGRLCPFGCGRAPLSPRRGRGHRRPAAPYGGGLAARGGFAGHDLVFTCGELTTDPVMHGPSKVAGETRFVIDLRSLSTEVMARMAAEARHRG